jgi:hypothetical protein
VHPIADQARTAYAVGWASTGGPMTDRVRAGCVAAVALACEHADDPHILEATLELGALEGTWAAVFARRDILYGTQKAALLAAVRALFSAVDFTDAIDQYRAAVGITESDRSERDRHRAEAIAAILAVLLPALANHDDPDYQTLLTTMVNTLRDAQAEGAAGAIAIAGEQAGLTGINFDAAFADHQAELAAADYFEASATTWMQTIVEGMAGDVGRAVVAVADEGGSATDMITVAEDLVADGALPTVELLADAAMTQAFGLGAITIYTRGGATLIDIMTAGDGRVCKICANAEASGPYAVLDAPVIPMHPWCRCVQIPHDPLDPVNFAQYATSGTAGW